MIKQIGKLWNRAGVIWCIILGVDAYMNAGSFYEGLPLLAFFSIMGCLNVLHDERDFKRNKRG